MRRTRLYPRIERPPPSKARLCCLLNQALDRALDHARRRACGRRLQERAQPGPALVPPQERSAVARSPGALLAMADYCANGAAPRAGGARSACPTPSSTQASLDDERCLQRPACWPFHPTRFLDWSKNPSPAFRSGCPQLPTCGKPASGGLRHRGTAAPQPAALQRRRPTLAGPLGCQPRSARA